MKYIYKLISNYGDVFSALACEYKGWWFDTTGRHIFFFLKTCFWSVNGDPVLRICHRPVWQSVKVLHSKQFTDSQKQICNRPEPESVCYLGVYRILGFHLSSILIFSSLSSAPIFSSYHHLLTSQKILLCLSWRVYKTARRCCSICCLLFFSLLVISTTMTTVFLTRLQEILSILLSPMGFCSMSLLQLTCMVTHLILSSPGLLMI